ncbi:hypothetical protein AVEN_154351-1 [Araneus ventricosus]|uniref:Uncharacterized protein n=1 Tax=Araneus ventricosus TaxID=182803 RepID=A0A4Y2SEI6_ARAVE|nr:hypothetical protein AVEN_154351-1 [Araneus ventricosus]
MSSVRTGLNPWLSSAASLHQFSPLTLTEFILFQNAHSRTLGHSALHEADAERLTLQNPGVICWNIGTFFRSLRSSKILDNTGESYQENSCWNIGTFRSLPQF